MFEIYFTSETGLWIFSQEISTRKELLTAMKLILRNSLAMMPGGESIITRGQLNV